MYLRFVLAKAQPKTRRRIGILRVTGSCDSEEVDEIVRRLGIHLPIPPRESFSGGRGVCWFKLEARECIERVREVAFLLEKRRSERIWQIYSRNPGLITYEDDYQIVAVPEAARIPDWS